MKMKQAEVIVSPEHLVVSKKRGGRCVYCREDKRALVAACLQQPCPEPTRAVAHSIT